MPTELRPYQWEGVTFLTNRRHAMLLDEPGMGKSVQAILAATPPVLISTRAYAVRQWERFILNEYPDAIIACADGTRLSRQRAVAAGADWTVINTEMFRDFPLRRSYRTLILDESHHLRGHTSQQHIGALSVASRPTTEYVFELTATPVRREVDDFFGQLRLLDPPEHKHRGPWVAKWCNVTDDDYGPSVQGARDPEAFREMLSRYALLRTYKSVGLQLPELIPVTIPLRPSPEWYKAYRNIRDNYRIEDITFDSAPEVMRMLRSLTIDLKIKAAKELAQDNDRAVYFTWHRDAAHAAAEALNLPCITGSVAPSERLTMVRAYGSIVATIASLSEAVDLSHLNTIVELEQSYLPGDRTQAIARVRRWNPANTPVRLITLQVERTIDTTIARMSGRRQGDIVAILRDELSETPDEAVVTT